jgi:hypothetical protein
MGRKKREGELIFRRNSWATTPGAVTALRTTAMLTQTNPHGGGLSCVQRALERIHVYTSVCTSCGFLNHRISSDVFVSSKPSESCFIMAKISIQSLYYFQYNKTPPQFAPHRPADCVRTEQRAAAAAAPSPPLFSTPRLPHTGAR